MEQGDEVGSLRQDEAHVVLPLSTMALHGLRVLSQIGGQGERKNSTLKQEGLS